MIDGLTLPRGDPRSYLLVPMMPTPNGPLHLGHIAGPYLKMDVLARALRQEGHQVALISTTDAFESHVLQSACKHALSMEATCAQFHEAIQRDFDYMNICFDAFLNPLCEPWARHFKTVHGQVTDSLLARGRARFVEELYLVDDETSEPVLGFRLSGNCPNCSSDTVGFVCENCGLQVTTQMLVAPGNIENGAALSWRSGETIAVDVEDREKLKGAITAARLPAEFKHAMIEFLMCENNLIRLTTLSDHCVAKHCLENMHFNLYNSYFGHAVFCGDVYSRLVGDARNPFHLDSEVITVTSCGLDNATDIASCMACAEAHGQNKGFDHALGNFFLSLQGKKFSTSLAHAIFVSDLAKRPTIDTDAVRFYLSEISPHDKPRNFEIDEFVEFYNDWFVETLGLSVTRAYRAIADGSVNTPSKEILSLVETAMLSRRQALALESHSPAEYTAAIRQYCLQSDRFLDDSNEAYFWIRGLLLVASPLMPVLCARIRKDFGLPDDEMFSEDRCPPPGPPKPSFCFSRIGRADLPW